MKFRNAHTTVSMITYFVQLAPAPKHQSTNIQYINDNLITAHTLNFFPFFCQWNACRQNAKIVFTTRFEFSCNIWLFIQTSPLVLLFYFVYYILYDIHMCVCVCIYCLYDQSVFHECVALKFSTIHVNIENEFVFFLSLRLWLDMNKTWKSLMFFHCIWVWCIIFMYTPSLYSI